MRCATGKDAGLGLRRRVSTSQLTLLARTNNACELDKIYKGQPMTLFNSGHIRLVSSNHTDVRLRYSPSIPPTPTSFVACLTTSKPCLHEAISPTCFEGHMMMIVSRSDGIALSRYNVQGATAYFTLHAPKVNTGSLCMQGGGVPFLHQLRCKIQN